MASKKPRTREIPDYDLELLAIVDISKAMRPAMHFDIRRRLLQYIVHRELGDNYFIEKK